MSQNNNLPVLAGALCAKIGLEGQQQAVIDTLRQTVFSKASDAQCAALLIVASQYGLNPLTKEIYAYPDKNGGIVPVVGVDGWTKIINEHPQFNGIDFIYSPETLEHKGKRVHEWIECVIYRKDRENPVKIREYFDEVCRSANFATPWDSHPKRMHRHKVLIQAARTAFGFAGVYDEDEAERITEKDITPVSSRVYETEPKNSRVYESEPKQHPSPPPAKVFDLSKVPATIKRYEAKVKSGEITAEEAVDDATDKFAEQGWGINKDACLALRDTLKSLEPVAVIKPAAIDAEEVDENGEVPF